MENFMKGILKKVKNKVMEGTLGQLMKGMKEILFKTREKD